MTAAERWRHVGPTLFWTLQEPEIGQTFSTPSGRFAVISIEPEEPSGGWLVLVEPA